MAYDKLVYERGEKSKEAQRIEFQIQRDLTIKEFKRTCRRMAHALGYSSTNIEEHFGKETEVGNKQQLKLLFD